MQNQYNQYNLEAPFRTYLSAENISPISLKNYLSDLRHFLGWFQGEQRSSSFSVHSSQNKAVVKEFNADSGVTQGLQNDVLAAITPNMIAEYKSYLSANGVPTKTVNRRLSALRKFFTFAISQGWTKENPAKKINNIASLTNSGNLATDLGVGLDRSKKGTGQDLSLLDILRKYESSLQEKGLRKAQINENVTVVRELLQISD